MLARVEEKAKKNLKDTEIFLTFVKDATYLWVSGSWTIAELWSYHNMKTYCVQSYSDEEFVSEPRLKSKNISTCRWTDLKGS